MIEIMLKYLKNLWNDEKEFYDTAEVGSGVQKFCYKVLQ